MLKRDELLRGLLPPVSRYHSTRRWEGIDQSYNPRDRGPSRTMPPRPAVEERYLAHPDRQHQSCDGVTSKDERLALAPLPLASTASRITPRAARQPQVLRSN